MKIFFWLGCLGLLFFEIANVYFIMPMPGSQKLNTIAVAYFLYKWRWACRIVFILLMTLGLFKTTWTRKWAVVSTLIILMAAIYIINFKMAADTMFYQPSFLQMSNAGQNTVATNRLILGVMHNGQAKAYPIQFLGYHHQVRDSVGGKPIIVTYCTVCRTGRVFEPIVNDKTDNFRLVGMDHFNAMFEDKTTHSWWRQVNGQAIAGPLKGKALPEFASTQTTLGKWIELYPETLIMQPDKKFKVEYDSMSTYEKGNLIGKLTKHDTASWQPKSWVVGIKTTNKSVVYDWNRLQKEHVIYDVVENIPIVLILSKDSNSFFAYERISKEQFFSIKNDTLITPNNRYNLLGLSQNKNLPNLKKINAYQEYWHSWQNFHAK